MVISLWLLVDGVGHQTTYISLKICDAGACGLCIACRLHHDKEDNSHFEKSLSLIRTYINKQTYTVYVKLCNICVCTYV